MRYQLTTIISALLLGLLPTTVLAGPITARATPTPKRGLPYNDVTYIQKWNGAGSQIKWAYNWASTTATTFPSYLEFVPMLWGDAAGHTATWLTNANHYLSKGSKHLLAFNEPDNKGQSNMTPQQAVNAYKTYLMPFAKNASLGAPAVTNGPTGLPWLESFIKLCTGCKIDFVPIHWYAQTSDVTYFKNYMTQAHNASGDRTLWITEFHAAGTVAQQTVFLNTILPWLDQQSYIARYAWFYASPTYNNGPIVNSTGSPTALGNIYGYHAY